MAIVTKPAAHASKNVSPHRFAAITLAAAIGSFTVVGLAAGAFQTPEAAPGGVVPSGFQAMMYGVD